MNNDSDTTALITLSHKRKEIGVTYRGTYNVWNVVLDALFFNVIAGNGTDDIKLHMGLYSATMSLYDEVVKHVSYLRFFYPSYKLILSGHSLGEFGLCGVKNTY